MRVCLSHIFLTCEGAERRKERERERERSTETLAAASSRAASGSTPIVVNTSQHPGNRWLQHPVVYLAMHMTSRALLPGHVRPVIAALAIHCQSADFLTHRSCIAVICSYNAHDGFW